MLSAWHTAALLAYASPKADHPHVFSLKSDLGSGLKREQFSGPRKCVAKDAVVPGKRLRMHYTGEVDASSPTARKGKRFGSAEQATFDFQIGRGEVLPGWERGLLGLCKGAMARLIVPPELGYGWRGVRGKVPGNATLKFVLEVVDVNPGSGRQQSLARDKIYDSKMAKAFDDADYDDDGLLSKKEVKAFFRRTHGLRKLPKGFWEAEDRDGDGFITAEEFGGSIVQGPMEAPGPDLFGEMDADGNGLLSKVETTAHYNTAGGFAAEDRNSDGVIDWFEFKGPKSEMPPPMGEVNHAEL